MDDPNLRLRVVNALKIAGFRLSKDAFRKKAKYSRFFNSSVDIDDMTDTEEVCKKVDMLYQKLEPQIAKAEKVFRKVFQK